MPASYLSPPNDGVCNICYLTHGRDEYDDYPEVKRYQDANRKWWENGKQGPPPTHWRILVRDKFAGIPIHEDTEHVPTQEDGWRRHWLYEPAELQEVLVTAPRVIKAIHYAVEQDYDITSARRVHKEILSVVRNEFRMTWDVWFNANNTGSQLAIVSSGNIETAWRKAVKSLEATAELIAGCLFLHYDRYPLEWSARIIMYGEPSDRWKEHMERVNRVASRPVIERAGGSSRSFVSEDSLGDVTEVGLTTSSFIEEG